MIPLCFYRLGCWCKPEACHGDVLVELVNQYCTTGGTANTSLSSTSSKAEPVTSGATFDLNNDFPSLGCATATNGHSYKYKIKSKPASSQSDVTKDASDLDLNKDFPSLAELKQETTYGSASGTNQQPGSAGSGSHRPPSNKRRPNIQAGWNQSKPQQQKSFWANK